MIDPALCAVHPPAASAEDVIRLLAGKLHAAGHVTEGFVRAALAREKRSPTGLPFPGIAVALPHAEPEHVTTPAIAVATLSTPVVFREMGDPASKLSVALVVMPAFSAKEQAAAQLSSLIERLQDEALRARLLAAPDAAALAAALAGEAP